jgi:hypothetical protein
MIAPRKDAAETNYYMHDDVDENGHPRFIAKRAVTCVYAEL